MVLEIHLEKATNGRVHLESRFKIYERQVLEKKKHLYCAYIMGLLYWIIPFLNLFMKCVASFNIQKDFFYPTQLNVNKKRLVAYNAHFLTVC